MAANNAKVILRGLAEKAKAKGSISHSEIMDALADVDVNPDTIDSFYIKLESMEIEIIEDDESISLESLQINDNSDDDDDRSNYYNEAEAMGIYVEDPVKAYLSQRSQ